MTKVKAVIRSIVAMLCSAFTDAVIDLNASFSLQKMQQ